MEGNKTFAANTRGQCASLITWVKIEYLDVEMLVRASWWLKLFFTNVLVLIKLNYRTLKIFKL